MGKTKFYVYIAFLLGYLFSPEYCFENYLLITGTLFGLAFFEFVDGFGKRIHPLDVAGMYAATVYLFAPALLFHLKDLGWYMGYAEMSVGIEEYFVVALPATIALLIGLSFPFRYVNEYHDKYLPNIGVYLEERPSVGPFLFWVGAISILLRTFIDGLGLFVELASQLIFIGAIYIWFTPKSKNKTFYLIVVFMAPVVQAVQEGMFGTVVFWGLFMMMLLSLRYKVSFIFKVLPISVGFLLMLFIQSIKSDYRQMTYFLADGGNLTISAQVGIMQGLWKQRMETPELLFGPVMMSSVIDRANQGKLVSMAISYVPASEPFADGETIYSHLLASFIPRFLWPDKPEVGGRANMIRFTGYEPNAVTSMDIGPLGDGYVNFGAKGNIIFMFLYGFAFSLVLYKLFSIGIGGQWSMILWIPLFYAGAVKMDSSFLACAGHIIKSGIFAVIIILGYKTFTNEDM